MKIEIITVGDEILIGQIIDTNSAWMAAELTRQGFETVAITTVGDQEEDMAKAIDTGFSRADVLLMTGELDPPDDDYQKTTLHTSVRIIFNEKVLSTNQPSLCTQKLSDE